MTNQAAATIASWRPLNFPGFAEAGQRILVATGQPIVRSALCWAIFKAHPESHIEDLDDLDGLIQRLRNTADVSVIVLGRDLLEGQSAQSIAACRAAFGVAQVLVLAGDAPSPSTVGLHSALPMTALPKPLPLSQMLQAVGAALEARSGRPDPMRPQVRPLCRGDSPLTPAQGRILAAAATGLLNKQIAFEMGVAETTVKAHMSAIFKKLGVRNRTQAINLVRRGELAGVRL